MPQILFVTSYFHFRVPCKCLTYTPECVSFNIINNPQAHGRMITNIDNYVNLIAYKELY